MRGSLSCSSAFRRRSAPGRRHRVRDGAVYRQDARCAERTPSLRGLTRSIPASPRLPLEVILRAVELALEDSATDVEQYSCWSARGLDTTCDGCHICARERVKRVLPFLALNGRIRHEATKIARRVFHVPHARFGDFADVLADETIRRRVKRLTFGSAPDFERPLLTRDQTWWTHDGREPLLQRLACCHTLTDLQVPAGSICRNTYYFSVLPDHLLAQLTSFSIWGGSLVCPENAGVCLVRQISRMTNLVKLRLSGLRYFYSPDLVELTRPANLKELTLGLSHGLHGRLLEWFVGTGAQVPALTLDCTRTEPDWLLWELGDVLTDIAAVSDRITHLTVHSASSSILDYVFGWRRLAPTTPTWPALRHLVIRTGLTWGRDPHQEQAMGWMQMSDGTRRYLIQWPLFLYARETSLLSLRFDIVMARSKTDVRPDINRIVVSTQVVGGVVEPYTPGASNVRIDWAMVGYPSRQAADEAVPSVTFCSAAGHA